MLFAKVCVCARVAILSCTLRCVCICVCEVRHESVISFCENEFVNLYVFFLFVIVESVWAGSREEFVVRFWIGTWTHCSGNISLYSALSELIWLIYINFGSTFNNVTIHFSIILLQINRTWTDEICWRFFNIIINLWFIQLCFYCNFHLLWGNNIFGWINRVFKNRIKECFFMYS